MEYAEQQQVQTIILVRFPRLFEPLEQYWTKPIRRHNARLLKESTTRSCVKPKDAHLEQLDTNCKSSARYSRIGVFQSLPHLLDDVLQYAVLVDSERTKRKQHTSTNM